MTTRRCPRCTFTLAPHRLRDVELDVCPRCQGLFVDHGEGGTFLGPYGDVGAWSSRGVARAAGEGRLSCPAGPHGRMTLWHVALPGGGSVEVDACPHCRGLWLDAGEARRLVVARGARAAGSSSSSSSSSSAAAAAAAAAAPSSSSPRRSTPAAAPTEPVSRLNEPPPGEEKTGVGWYLLQAFTAVPVEVYNPKRRVALVCLALIAACVGAFVYEFGAIAAGDEGFIRRFGCVPADLFAGRNVVGVVTHMFLHGGVGHLLGNMWFLWTFGDNVEDRVGRLRFLLLYLAFGVVAVVAHAALTTSPGTPLVGASGAISGLMGAYLALFPRAKFWQILFFFRFRLPVWFYVCGWALANVLSGLAEREGTLHAGVAWWAHVGGFVAGLAWGVVFGGAYRDGAEAARAVG